MACQLDCHPDDMHGIGWFVLLHPRTRGSIAQLSCSSGLLSMAAGLCVLHEMACVGFSSLFCHSSDTCQCSASQLPCASRPTNSPVHPGRLNSYKAD